MSNNFSIPETEYSKLTNLLQNKTLSKDEIYLELINKEKNALTTINRVVDHEQKKQYDDSLFYNMPLLTILALFINTWRNIFLELMTMHHFDIGMLYEVFSKKDRKIYVGLMLLFITFFMYVIDIF